MRTVLLHVLIMFLVATTARAETLSEIANAFDGQRVTEIRFRTNLNLDAGDLGRNLPLQVGDRLSPAELLESVTVLQDRGIFEHVDVTVRPTNAGVRIDFLLTPLLRVGEIDIVGGEELDRDRIRRATGFRAGSAFQASVLRRSVERLTTFFASMGYYDARTLVHVLERPNAGDLFIRYELDLGRQAEIGDVRFAKPISEENRERVERITNNARGDEASEERIKLLIREILLALRAEGYLQSSVRLTSKTIEPGSGVAQLELNITERTPVTMYFRGNTAFTPTELLSPLKLDTRTVLFSPTAIPALCRAIEKMYQERGYFLVKVDCSVAPSDDDRRVYNITIDEGARLRLRSLAFEGESEIGPQELSSAVTTEEAGPFFLRVWQPGYVINETVAQDVVRLEELYRDRGYNEATVQPLFTLDESGDAIQGTFQIDQGDPVLLETVETQWLHPDGTPIGATDIPAELRDVTSGIVAGARSSPGALDYERERLLALILERGFPEVIVAVALSDDGKSAQISITPGALVRVRKIVVRGNYYTHDDVIRRDLRIAPGDLWTPIPLERTTQELLKTGLFRTVLLEPADGALDSSDEDLAVTVEERDTGTFDLGVGLDTEDGLHLTGELGQRNFEGNGDAVVLVMDAYFKNGDRVFDAGRIKGLYRRPHFITPSNDLLVETFLQHSIETIDEFSFDRIGASTSIRHEFQENLTGVLGCTVFDEHVFDVAPDVIAGDNDEGSSIYSGVKTQLEYDARDDRYNPTRGGSSNLQAQYFPESLGSAVELWGLAARQTFYVPVNSALVWANSLRGEMLRPLNDTEVVPLSQRLFLGGRNSLRGFTRNKIGPRGVENDIAGGDTAVVFNTELQYTFMEDVVAVTFLDVGQSYLENRGRFDGDAKSVEKLRYSPGFGIRYKTPIGPLSAEYGFALDREAGERPGRLFLGIGGAF